MEVRSTILIIPGVETPADAVNAATLFMDSLVRYHEISRYMLKSGTFNSRDHGPADMYISVGAVSDTQSGNKEILEKAGLLGATHTERLARAHSDYTMGKITNIDAVNRMNEVFHKYDWGIHKEHIPMVFNIYTQSFYYTLQNNEWAVEVYYE